MALGNRGHTWNSHWKPQTCLCISQKSCTLCKIYIIIVNIHTICINCIIFNKSKHFGGSYQDTKKQRRGTPSPFQGRINKTFTPVTNIQFGFTSFTSFTSLWHWKPPRKAQEGQKNRCQEGLLRTPVIDLSVQVWFCKKYCKKTIKTGIVTSKAIVRIG